MSRQHSGPSAAKRFLGNTGWILCERVLHLALSLITTSLTARYLGPSNAGLIDYGASFISIFTIVCKLGIDSILVNEIIRNREDAGKLLGTTIGLRLLSSVAAVGMTAVAVLLLNPGKPLILVITLIQSVSLLFVAFDTLDFWFQSQLQSRYTAMAKFISFLLVCGLRLTLVALRADVYWFALATVTDAFIIGAMLLLFYRKTAAYPLKFSAATAKYLLALSRPFILSALLITVYTQMDKIMLGSMAGEHAVGIYDAAAKICNMWMFVPIAVIDSARPMIMSARATDRDGYLRRYRRLYAAIIWGNIAAALAITLLARPIILLLYGEAFGESIAVLPLLIWSRLFSLMGTTRGIWIVCEGFSRYVKFFAGGGAVLNLILNAWLIPVIGPLGAAVATLATEIFTALVLPLLFRETRPLGRIMLDAFLLRKLK